MKSIYINIFVLLKYPSEEFHVLNNITIPKNLFKPSLSRKYFIPSHISKLEDIKPLPLIKKGFQTEKTDFKSNYTFLGCLGMILFVDFLFILLQLD